MTGLETILEQIQKESDQKVSDIILKAKMERDQIISAAEKRALEIVQKAEEQSKREAREAVERGLSAAELMSRQNELQKKQRLIDQVIDQAYQSLLQLSDEEYYDLILKMIKRYAEDQEGEIVFSEKDKKRLNMKFKMSMAMLTHRLKISDEVRDIDGGFILVYGDIEINCTFRAILDESRDMLKDKISHILFD